MKWSVLVVILLGLLAAACMAGIVMFLPTYLHGPKRAVRPEVEILVAGKDLPAMQIVDATSLVTRKVPKDAAPSGYLSDPVQAAGKVLIMPLVRDQAFTKSCFATDGSGAHVASALPRGMRAIGVALSDDSGLLTLLYPGSLVDVLVAYKPVDKGEAVSHTLLQNIQVLAVENRTVVSEDDAKASPSERHRKRVVTLMMDGEQAKTFQAAVQQGTISLALRNPMDRATAVAQAAPHDQAQTQTQPAGTPPAAVPQLASIGRTWEITILRNRQPEIKKFSEPVIPR